jgi:hypothetical protein
MTPVLPGQTIAVDPKAVKAFRPTYRLLSYCLASNGFPASNDLAEPIGPIWSMPYSMKSMAGLGSHRRTEWLDFER